MLLGRLVMLPRLLLPGHSAGGARQRATGEWLCRWKCPLQTACLQQLGAIPIGAQCASWGGADQAAAAAAAAAERAPLWSGCRC